jgi:hypothetical protein
MPKESCRFPASDRNVHSSGHLCVLSGNTPHPQASKPCAHHFSVLSVPSVVDNRVKWTSEIFSTKKNPRSPTPSRVRTAVRPASMNSHGWSGPRRSSSPDAPTSATAPSLPKRSLTWSAATIWSCARTSVVASALKLQESSLWRS